MSKSKDLEKNGPVIYVTPVPDRQGSFMCSIKKNKNPSEDEQTCEIMAMGMMMLSPLIISLPFKIMLFVLVDGWTLVLGSLASSFVL